MPKSVNNPECESKQIRCQFVLENPQTQQHLGQIEIKRLIIND